MNLAYTYSKSITDATGDTVAPMNFYNRAADRGLANYDRTQVLHDINLRVDKSEIVGLVGANGAGKSSTLLSIMGIKTRTSGEVWLDGSPSVNGSERNPSIPESGYRGYVYARDVNVLQDERGSCGTAAITQWCPGQSVIQAI